jgi:hypothetical protein
MSSNNNFKETFLTKKGEDVTFGEDSTDLMVVNSNAEFTGTLTANGGLVGGGGVFDDVDTLTTAVAQNVTSIGAMNVHIPYQSAMGTDTAGDEVVLGTSGHLVFQKPLSYKYKISDTEDRTAYQNIASLDNNGSPIEIIQLRLDALTPRSVNSKIKLHGAVCGGWDEHSYDKGIIIGRNVGQNEEFIRSGPIASTANDAAGNPIPSIRARLLAAWLGDSHHFNELAPAALNFVYIDAPATTSAIIYKIYLVNTRAGSDTKSFYFNSTKSDSNVTSNEVGVSTFIAEEKG